MNSGPFKWLDEMIDRQTDCIKLHQGKSSKTAYPEACANPLLSNVALGSLTGISKNLTKNA